MYLQNNVLIVTVIRADDLNVHIGILYSLKGKLVVRNSDFNMVLQNSFLCQDFIVSFAKMVAKVNRTNFI